MSPARRVTLLALLLCAVAFGLNAWLCSKSAALYLPLVFGGSDMNTNVHWAESIRDQGWLNPNPYHPYPRWMREVGTYDEWIRWWGGPKIFQQSPLYAYLVAASLTLFDDLMPVHWLQVLLAVALCAALGRLAWRITGAAWAAPAAMVVTAAYAPLQVYSWALLRDFPGWVLTALALLALVELDCAETPRGRRWASAALGVTLGLGFLGRESYLLLAPAMLAFAGWVLWRKREPAAGLLALAPFLACVALLVTRNALVGAPLLSSSNRISEAIVIGNAVSTQPAVFTVPPEMRALFEGAQGSMWRLFVDTVKTHPSLFSWLWLQLRKVLSLFDPVESCDNVSLGFYAHVSPFARFGLTHWMVIVPGVVGLVLSALRKDTRHRVLWGVLPLLAANVLINIPVSRYRQALVILWIPWAVYAAWVVLEHARNKRWRPAAVPVAATLAAWALCWGPLRQLPARLADRPAEYQMAIGIYDKLNDGERAAEMRALLHAKFPGEPESPPDEPPPPSG